MSTSPICTVPSARASGLVSCMRLRQRTNVDLPQPEGPISAVAWFARNVQAHIVKRVHLPIPGIQILDANVDTHLISSLERAAIREKRTNVTETIIITISTSAPAHASRCHSS